MMIIHGIYFEVSYVDKLNCRHWPMTELDIVESMN